MTSNLIQMSHLAKFSLFQSFNYQISRIRSTLSAEKKSANESGVQYARISNFATWEHKLLSLINGKRATSSNIQNGAVGSKRKHTSDTNEDAPEQRTRVEDNEIDENSRHVIEESSVQHTSGKLR